MHNSPDNILLYNQASDLRDSPLKDAQQRFINVYSNENRFERASLTEAPRTHFITLSNSKRLEPERPPPSTLVCFA